MGDSHNIQFGVHAIKDDLEDVILIPCLQPFEDGGHWTLCGGCKACTSEGGTTQIWWSYIFKYERLVRQLLWKHEHSKWLKTIMSIRFYWHKSNEPLHKWYVV